MSIDLSYRLVIFSLLCRRPNLVAGDERRREATAANNAVIEVVAEVLLRETHEIRRRDGVTARLDQHQRLVELCLLGLNQLLLH